MNNYINNDKKLYYTFDGTQPIVMLCSYEYAKKLYKVQLQRNHQYLGYVYDVLFSECIGTKDSQIWLNMKKPLDKYFNTNSIKTYYNKITEYVDIWIKTLYNKKIISELGFERLMMKFLANMVFGNCDEDDYIELLIMSKMHEKVLNILGTTYAIRYGFKIGYKNEISVINGLKIRWINFVNRKIEQNNNIGLIPHILNSSEYINSQAKIYHTLYELILFNADVMVNAITYLLLDITMNLDIQKKLHLEIMNKIIDADNINNFIYLNNVINESARLHPGVLQTFTDSIKADITLGNNIFKEGTMFSLDTIAINTDTDLWTNPKIFNPDRYQNNDINKIHRFGLGPRKCIGRLVSDYILKYAIIKILQNYQLKLIHNSINLNEPYLRNLANYFNNSIVEFIPL